MFDKYYWREKSHPIDGSIQKIKRYANSSMKHMFGSIILLAVLQLNLYLFDKNKDIFYLEKIVKI
jgi:hypothetical protein